MFVKDVFMCNDDISDVTIAHVSLEYRSVMTAIFWFTCDVLGSDPTIYNAMK